MKSIIVFFLFLVLSHSSFSKDNKELAKTYELFSQGRYQDVVDSLEKIETSEEFQKLRGLILYWKALSYSRLSEFDLSIQNFQGAIVQGYISDDLYYEFAQVLYMSDKLEQARIAFKNSVTKKYKVAVSLYYIGYICERLGESKKAVSYYKMVESSDDPEKAEVIQPALVQIGDIYLAQVEKKGGSLYGVEKYVIPQYKKALKINKDSSTALAIAQKIEALQKKYDLVLFKMINGKQTQRPPYFIKFGYGLTNDSNVNNVSDSSSNKSTNEESIISNYSFFGRYSFYLSNQFSFATELIGNYSKYASNKDEIKANDNYNVTGGLKLNYEHLFNKKPATTYIEYEYGYNANRSELKSAPEKFDTSHFFGISEELQFIKNNPTTFRYYYRRVVGVDEDNSYSTGSIIWEQLYAFSKFSFFSYLSYDQSFYDEVKEKNNNAFVFRLDLILPTFYNLFNPNFFITTTTTRYQNDSDKGVTSSFGPGISLNRPLAKNLYGTLTYSTVKQTGKLSDDKYSKNTISFNLDYIY